MAPRVTSEYSEFRKRQIITAAWECFADKGYRETTIRDIARKLKLSTGIIYCHFKGKADILEAVQECGRANTEDMLDRIAREKTTREAVREIIRAVALQMPVAVRRRNAKAAIHLWAEAIKKASYRRVYIKQYGLVEKALSRIVSEGVKRGELRREIDPDAFAAYLLAVISGLQVQSVLNDIPDPDRYSEDIAACVLDRLWNKDDT
jgi:AcrR family transcriptional regulator